MCCFTQSVISVSDTQIFARLSGRGTQFLAYQMNYESSGENAMILPLPVKQPANDKSLRFVDLSHYDSFFDDMADGFAFRAPASIGCSSSKDVASSARLMVFEVGNYIASFVPTIHDFNRLDPKFTLPKDVWEKIPGYESFGFAVFQLAAGSLKPHPMALEFQSDRQDLFFPTVHIHDGELHESEDFDHILYMQHAGLDSRVYGYQNAHVKDKSTGLERSKFPMAQFVKVEESQGLVDGDLLLHRTSLRGKLPNVDTVFSVGGDPVRPSFNFRPLLPFAPWLIILAAFGWIFSRRATLKRLRESSPTQPNNNIPSQPPITP
jgi:hypothetical protein